MPARRGARGALLAALLALTVGLPAAQPLTAPPVPPLPPLAVPDPCPADAPVRSYAVVALALPVVYNHWGDADPQGEVLVLAQDEQAVLQQVADSYLASAVRTAQRVAGAQGLGVLSALGYQFPTGLAGVPDLDPVQPSPLVRPLIVRAHVGDCVELDVTNKLAEPMGLHAHRAVTPPGQGGAFGQDALDLALPGESRAFRTYIPDEPGMEGAHFLHSHADARDQTRHGLFGAIIAEPRDAAWLGPDGQAMDNGPEAIITRPDAPDFREFVVMFQDEISLVDHAGNPLPVVSPYGEYGPGTKGINLRSEPFMDRFQLHDRLGPQGAGELDRGHDKSLAYSSYTYGDPSTFIPRSYVGDPTKIRLVNAGPGQHHVFHLHGGGDRWRSSPVSEPTQLSAGLVKDNPVPASRSERLDVQDVGPGESFNIEVEGGAGGTQQSAGDFLYHCHIVEHYVAGMLGFWRVLNTLQPGLAELPDRAGAVQGAVDSTGLLGRAMPDGTVLTASNLAAWVEAQLPPRGAPGADDASSWDWSVRSTPAGPLYLGEPEDTRSWPGYASAHPGERRPILFDPVNGRLSYPLLQPHLGKRPPFAPMHGPAPYLGPDVQPGRPDGLCPAGARHLSYNVVAVNAAVPYNAQDVDAQGQVYVLAEDKAAVLGGTKPAQNLVLRANAGDCVDVLLTSQLRLAPEQAENGESKVNMHIHLVQFDVQASDGVITGFNYEQSVRSAASTGTALASPAAAGDARIRVLDASQVRPGTRIGVGLTEADVELRGVLAVQGQDVLLDAPLGQGHAAGERVGAEFVRYRWYPDVELGAVFWHDHVDGLNSWRRGLIGALVVEPRGSNWTDPGTGAPLRSGPVADVWGYSCAYRELVAEVQDNASLPDRASLNLRSNPLAARSDGFRGAVSTDTLRAYAGDPVEVRLVYGGQSSSRAVGTFAVSGHRFPVEQRNPGSRLTDAVSLGISSQFNLRLDGGAGGTARLPGAYWLGMTQPELQERGAWGVMQVYGAPRADLRPLPGHAPQPGELPAGPVRRYDVVAMHAQVVYNARDNLSAGTDLFALASEAGSIAKGTLRPTPLVLRALPGERVEVNLTNRLGRAVNLQAAMLPADPRDTGTAVGDDPDTSTAPGATRTYAWFADRELGAVRLASTLAPSDTLRGLYGALVVEPAGSSFANATGIRSDLRLANGTAAREHVLLYASDDPGFEASTMPYSEDVHGIVSVDYRSEPLAARLLGRLPALTPQGEPVGGLGVSTCQLNADTCTVSLPGGKGVRLDARNPLDAFAYDSAVFGDPETPILDARQGELVVVRALGGAGDQLQVHGVEGHAWKRDPDMPGSEVVDFATLGPGEASNAWFVAGPGGAGDYAYGSQRGAFREAGAWGILRVAP